MPERVVEVADESGSLPESLLAELPEVARWTLRHERTGELELSIALLPDSGITRLNRDYLSLDRPTDVIAFLLEVPGAAPVGDVYIGVDQARRQAADLGIGLREELLRLAIHGILHVLGWDHPEDDRADAPMYARQEELLGSFLERI